MTWIVVLVERVVDEDFLKKRLGGLGLEQLIYLYNRLKNTEKRIPLLKVITELGLEKETHQELDLLYSFLVEELEEICIMETIDDCAQDLFDKKIMDKIFNIFGRSIGEKVDDVNAWRKLVALYHFGTLFGSGRIRFFIEKYVDRTGAHVSDRVIDAITRLDEIRILKRGRRITIDHKYVREAVNMFMEAYRNGGNEERNLLLFWLIEDRLRDLLAWAVLNRNNKWIEFIEDINRERRNLAPYFWFSKHRGRIMWKHALLFTNYVEKFLGKKTVLSSNELVEKAIEQASNEGVYEYLSTITWFCGKNHLRKLTLEYVGKNGIELEEGAVVLKPSSLLLETKKNLRAIKDILYPLIPFSDKTIASIIPRVKSAEERESYEFTIDVYGGGRLEKRIILYILADGKYWDEKNEVHRFFFDFIFFVLRPNSQNILVKPFMHYEATRDELIKKLRSTVTPLISYARVQERNYEKIIRKLDLLATIEEREEFDTIRWKKFVSINVVNTSVMRTQTFRRV